jgi:SAM-dependent methyltransferase
MLPTAPSGLFSPAAPSPDSALKEGPAPVTTTPQTAVASEVEHWNEIERQTRSGERIFWTQHPRVAYHYYRKFLVDGLPWQLWIPKLRNGPLESALEFGCGNGAALAAVLRCSTARNVVALDLDESRFAFIKESLGEAAARVRFVAADVNHIELEERSYDLIYAVQSFHHIENFEHVYARMHRALRPGGFCVLDEYVGPPRFQWTDRQLALTRQLLGLIPLHLRMYSNGMEKREEGRSSPEDVIRMCPSEAIRSDEIVPLFRKTFEVLHEIPLGGTIQHLLYSGIVHNFPDDDPATIHLIDCLDGLERVFIDYGVVPSDFMLLIGRKRGG